MERGVTDTVTLVNRLFRKKWPRRSHSCYDRFGRLARREEWRGMVDKRRRTSRLTPGREKRLKMALDRLIDSGRFPLIVILEEIACIQDDLIEIKRLLSRRPPR